MPGLGVTPVQPRYELLRHACSILEHGIKTCDSLLGIYETRRPIGTTGAPPNVEQDLLRAMVIMAGATLDAATGLAAKASFPLLYRHDRDVEKKVKDLIRQRVQPKDGKDEPYVTIPVDVLLKALYEEKLDPLLGAVANQLGAKGLQDKASMERVLGFVGLDIGPMWTAAIDSALLARNQIVHQLDATPEPPGGRGVRRRVRRTKTEMEGYAKALLGLAVRLLHEIDGRLAVANVPR